MGRTWSFADGKDQRPAELTQRNRGADEAPAEASLCGVAAPASVDTAGRQRDAEVFRTCVPLRDMGGDWGFLIAGIFFGRVFIWGKGSSTKVGCQLIRVFLIDCGAYRSD